MFFHLVVAENSKVDPKLLDVNAPVRCKSDTINAEFGFPSAMLGSSTSGCLDNSLDVSKLAKDIAARAEGDETGLWGYQGHQVIDMQGHSKRVVTLR